MRLSFIIAILITLPGCVHHDRRIREGSSQAIAYQRFLAQNDLPNAWFPGFLRDLRKDLPIRAGMSVDDVRRVVGEMNNRVRLVRTNVPPVFAHRELHLYLLSEFPDNDSARRGDSLTYFANGRHQFWLEMTIQQKKIKNIYVVPGNMSDVFPPFRYDGIGNHVGIFAYLTNGLARH